MWVKLKSLNYQYEVNEYGDVKNVKYKKILKNQTNHGYYTLTLRPKPYQPKTVRVHALVAEAFIGDRPKGYVINHKDGNKKNNYYKNLEYVTYSENNIHALRIGLRKPAHNKGRIGDLSPKHSINEKQAREILYQRYKTGYGERKLSKIMNLPMGAISGVISESRPRWKHINREEIIESLRKEGKLNAKFS